MVSAVPNDEQFHSYEFNDVVEVISAVQKQYTKLPAVHSLEFEQYARNVRTLTAEMERNLKKKNVVYSVDLGVGLAKLKKLIVKVENYVEQNNDIRVAVKKFKKLEQFVEKLMPSITNEVTKIHSYMDEMSKVLKGVGAYVMTGGSPVEIYYVATDGKLKNVELRDDEVRNFLHVNHLKMNMTTEFQTLLLQKTHKVREADLASRNKEIAEKLFGQHEVTDLSEKAIADRLGNARKGTFFIKDWPEVGEGGKIVYTWKDKGLHKDYLRIDVDSDPPLIKPVDPKGAYFLDENDVYIDLDNFLNSLK